jgi:hypothetical protein
MKIRKLTKKRIFYLGKNRIFDYGLIDLFDLATSVVECRSLETKFNRRISMRCFEVNFIFSK